MKISPSKTGWYGETRAAEYLQKRGYRILGRNVRSPFGEMDLVARDGKTLVFVEIKTRRGEQFGFPEEAVRKRKQAKLKRLALWYLKEFRLGNTNVRFDVVSIVLESSQEEIRLIQNAFEVDPD